MSRFDYIKYDQQSELTQGTFKKLVSDIEAEVNEMIHCPRSKAMVMTKLEEAYMWMGKGIRNDQIKRNEKFDLQESRTNS